MTSKHHFTCRVYYEDTDAGGVVYHANYLKFAERARTEMLRSYHIEQRALAQESDLGFVVHHLELKLIKPARLDDVLEIQTKVLEIKAATLYLEQSIFCQERLLATLKVMVVCVQISCMKPVRVPALIKEKLL